MHRVKNERLFILMAQSRSRGQMPTETLCLPGRASNGREQYRVGGGRQSFKPQSSFGSV